MQMNYLFKSGKCQKIFDARNESLTKQVGL